MPAPQVGLIAASVVTALGLGPDDVLLDLACGNGALSDQLFQCCAGGVGVDASEYLIGVAQEYFATPSRRYVMGDVVDWVQVGASPDRFTKAVCYGGFPYLSDDAASRMLHGLQRRFSRVGRVLLGNLPDPARAGVPHSAGRRVGRAPDLRTPDLRAPNLGIWRDEAEIAALAGPGWQVAIRPVPSEISASPPRYDAILARR